MLLELRKYYQRVKDSEQQMRNVWEEVGKEALEKIIKDVKEALNEYWSEYSKAKKHLKQEQKTLQFYIKAWEEGELSELQSSSANLYSLFQKIQNKIDSNKHFLRSFEYSFCYPHTKNTYSQLHKQHQLLQTSYNRIISFVLKNPNLKKQLPKQTQFIKQIHQHFETSNKKAQYKSKLSVKGSLESILENLILHEQVREQNLWVVSDSGVMSIKDYERLGEAIYRHRIWTEKLLLRIMDMEFCQEKCDVFKRKLTKMRLSELSIQNYYSQCKLGTFVGFNWHPFREKINISAFPWK